MDLSQGRLCEQVTELCEQRAQKILLGLGATFVGGKIVLSDKVRKKFPKTWDKVRELNRKINQSLGGKKGQTFSHRAAMAAKKGKVWGKTTTYVLDLLDPGHTEKVLKYAKYGLNRKLVTRKKRSKAQRA